MTDLRLAKLIGAIALATFCIGSTHAAPDSFRIRQLYSNQDGYNQFVELEEVAGNNGEDAFAGLTLTVTNRASVAKTFVFPDNLLCPCTAHRHVTIASTTLAAYLRQPDQDGYTVRVDFVMPDQFLPTDGGTIDFAGIDQWTFDGLPSDGLRSLLRTGAITTNWARTFTGDVVTYYSPFAGVFEYHNAMLDHYFMSGSQPDIDALDSGRISGWKRTGAALLGWGQLQPPGFFGAAVPVCRYYIPPAQGDSHFFSAFADECDAVGQQYPDFVLETGAAFYAFVPDRATGQCPSVPSGLLPVYRLWNNRADTNHRYTISRGIRDKMIQDGWVPEGYGPDGVVMCVGGGAPYPG